MTQGHFIAFCLGWAFGAALMSWYYHRSLLIRNRAEWKRAIYEKQNPRLPSLKNRNHQP